MRLVAAAKVRRAQDQVLKSRPLADKLARVLENIQSRVKFEAVDSPLLSKREDWPFANNTGKRLIDALD